MSIYDSMKFPPYQFREFPKRVVLIDGTEVEVNSSSEELSYAVQLRPAQLDPISRERNELAEQVLNQAQRIRDLEEKILAAQKEAKPVVTRIGT